jgi:hypothetical protein
MRFHPSPDSCDKGPVSQRNKKSFKPLGRVPELNRDGACSLRDFWFSPILDKARPSIFGKPAGLFLSLVEV